MPDQLIKRRGESKLLLLSGNWEKAEKWIRKRMDRPVTVDTVTGILDHFIVEPFVPHDEEDEHYVAITAQREGDTILFHHEGGVLMSETLTPRRSRCSFASERRRQRRK